MARLEAARRANGCLPARRSAIARLIPGGGVEPQAGDDRKSVAIAGINRDSFPATTIPETGQLLGIHRHPKQTGRGQRVGNRPGTIVAAIEKRSVTAAPAIRLGTQHVGGPERPFHRQRRPRRDVDDAAFQTGGRARDSRTVGRKRVGQGRRKDAEQKRAK